MTCLFWQTHGSIVISTGLANQFNNLFIGVQCLLLNTWYLARVPTKQWFEAHASQVNLETALQTKSFHVIYIYRTNNIVTSRSDLVYLGVPSPFLANALCPFCTSCIWFDSSFVYLDDIIHSLCILCFRTRTEH